VSRSERQYWSLSRGEVASLKIEADDNLHDIITVDLQDNTPVYIQKTIRYRKLMVKSPIQKI
jgi:hypothetical protein